MIININDDKKPWLKNALILTAFQNTLTMAFINVNKYLQTSTAPVDPWHFKVKVVELNFFNCFYVIIRTCTKNCPMLIK